MIVRNSEAALIRFELHDEDIFGEKHLIGQAMYPVSYVAYIPNAIYIYKYLLNCG